MNLFKKIFGSKTGSNFSLYSKFMIPLYLQLFLKKCVICRTVNYIKLNSDKNSLVSKIGKDLNKALALLFVITIAIHTIIYNMFLVIPFNIYISGVSIIILMFIIGFFIINIFLLRTLDKNIIQKFEKIKLDMNIIKKGDLSRRIKVNNCAIELNGVVSFTNDLLNKLEEAVEHEKKQALIDPLTSCYNRRALDINFNYIRNKTIRDKTTLSIVALDLDHFKRVNDTYGHNVGDEVLINFVKVIQENIRNHDFVYRIGGEEFLIIFTNINKQKTAKILNRLRKNIPYRLKKLVPKVEYSITVSGGFVSSTKYDLNKKKVLNDMMEDADKLLYQAKRSGRNRILG